MGADVRDRGRLYGPSRTRAAGVVPAGRPAGIRGTGSAGGGRRLMALSLSKAPDLARRRVGRALGETGLLWVTLLAGLRRPGGVRRGGGEAVEQGGAVAR